MDRHGATANVDLALFLDSWTKIQKVIKSWWSVIVKWLKWKKISLSPPYTSTFDCGRLLAGLNGIRSHTVCHRCSNPQEAIVPKSHRLALFKNKGENKSSKDLDCFTFSGWKRWTSLVITNMLNIQIYYSFLEIKKNIYRLYPPIFLH